MTKRKALALLLAVALTTSAQELPRTGETVEVSIVNVDFVVTDRAGKRVHGLKKDDFEVRENGKVQPISNFAEYVGDVEQGTVSVEAGAQPQAQAPVGKRAPRTLTIFFESMQLPGFAADNLVGALKKTVAGLVEEGDNVSVVIWTPVKVEHLEFTDDMDAVATALDRIGDIAKGVRFDEAAENRYEQTMRTMFMEEVEANGGQGDSEALAPTEEESPEMNMQLIKAFSEMQRRVAAINATIHSMSGIEGKKILLLATRRLGEVAGAEYVFRAGGDGLAPELKWRFGTEKMMKTIIDNANASSVTIYPVNPPGADKGMIDAETFDEKYRPDPIVMQTAEQQTLMNETISMERIAKQTGGMLATSTTDIIELLPRMASDATDYYSLAYRAGSAKADRARAITVKARNPEYVVRTRTQVVEKSDDTRMRDRVKAALFSADLPGATIDIQALKTPPKKGMLKSLVPVRVRIPIGALTTLAQQNGKYAGKFSVYVVASSDVDQLSDIVHKTQAFEIPAEDIEKARASVFTYDLELQVRNKSKYAAVGVFDEVGKSYGLTRIELRDEEAGP